MPRVLPHAAVSLAQSEQAAAVSLAQSEQANSLHEDAAGKLSVEKVRAAAATFFLEVGERREFLLNASTAFQGAT